MPGGNARYAVRDDEMTRAEIDKAYNIARWWQGLKDTTNERFLPLYADQHRYLVLKGGGGSGKSIFAGRKILERATSEPGHRLLVCRKVGRTLRESCFKQLREQAHEYYEAEIERIPAGQSGDMYMRFRNGSEIIFSGLDDVEKLKSIYNITGIWIEEATELEERDFDQLDIRLRGETKFYKQIILSFNPVSALHWIKRRFFDMEIRDPERLAEMRRRTRIHESTYKDNRFLDPEAVRTLEGFRETDEYYYQVYCLGMWGTTGKSVFNAKAVMARLEDHVQPVRVGFFEYDDDGREITNIRFRDDKNGFIRVYREPEAHVPYVIGGDTAGDGSDSFVAQVLDNRSGTQVCTLRHQFDEDLYARQVYCLGMWYNGALVGLENNFSTYPTMELERLRYPKQYVRESVDNYTHRAMSSYGFWTGTKTRPLIISELIKATREDMSIVCDEQTLQEMLTFVRSESWKPEAEEGAHDDCVMALAIAHYIRPQQAYTAEIEEAGTAEWTESMWEDYRAAGTEAREYLIRKWGKPKQ